MSLPVGNMAFLGAVIEGGHWPSSHQNDGFAPMNGRSRSQHQTAHYDPQPSFALTNGFGR